MKAVTIRSLRVFRHYSLWKNRYCLIVFDRSALSQRQQHVRATSSSCIIVVVLYHINMDNFNVDQVS